VGSFGNVTSGETESVSHISCNKICCDLNNS